VPKKVAEANLMNKSSKAKIQGAQRLYSYLQQQTRAVREGFRNYEEMVLSIPAFQAHPGWEEPGDEILVAGDLVLRKVAWKTWQEAEAIRVNGRLFVRTATKGPVTVSAVVRWFKRNHAEEAKRILEEESA
jgi:hypothetical protein